MAERKANEYKEVPTVYVPPPNWKLLLDEIEARKNLNLHQRISAMIGECERIPKNGWNDHYSFAYVTQADTVAMTGQLCAKYGVTIVSQPIPYPPQMHEIVQSFMKRLEESTDLEESKHFSQELRVMLAGWRRPEHQEWTDKQELTTMLFEFMVTNADKPEEFFIRYAWGEGLDGGDKGTYKAWSGAEKYFLFKLFQIPADTESDQSGMANDERRKERQEDRREDRSREQRNTTSRDKENLRQGDANRGHGNETTPKQETKPAAPAFEIATPTFTDMEVEIEVGRGEKKRIEKEIWTEITGTVIGNVKQERGTNKSLCVIIGIGKLPDYRQFPKERNNRFECYHKHLFDALAQFKLGSNVTFQYRTETKGDKAANPGSIGQLIEEVVLVDGRKFDKGVEATVDPACTSPALSFEGAEPAKEPEPEQPEGN